MSVIGASPVLSNARRVSRPGIRTVICWPGLKPSARFHSRGSIRTPALFAGITLRSSASRRPVGVAASRCVKKSLGNGSRQAPPPIGSQRAASAAGAAMATIAAHPSTAATSFRVICSLSSSDRRGMLAAGLRSAPWPSTQAESRNWTSSRASCPPRWPPG